MGIGIDHIPSHLPYLLPCPSCPDPLGPPHSVGYFIEPTIVETSDPTDRIMTEEIFGPVLSVFVYPDSQLDQMVTLANTSTPYALTGAIFAQDQ